jgi:hypothetical protein
MIANGIYLDASHEYAAVIKKYWPTKSVREAAAPPQIDRIVDPCKINGVGICSLE